MRLLLVGGSELLAWVIGCVAPPRVDVQHGRTFEEARSALRGRPPQAAIFAVTPSRTPWDQLAESCRAHQPPIPFIDYFDVGGEIREPGATGPHADLHTPVSTDELRAALEELLGSMAPDAPEATAPPRS